MIYFDNSATTKMFSESLDTFMKINQTIFGNPSSLHSYGTTAHGLVSQSRKQVADLLSVDETEIFFTSGGTEGNNWVIKGTAVEKHFFGKHIITSSIEHPSVSGSMRQLEQLGFEVTYLPVDQWGVISIEELEAAIRKDTILVSLMAVNNEIGSIQPLEKVGEVLQKYPAIHFHVDAIQAVPEFDKLLLHPRIDFLVFSAHKFHGPKGVGILYKKTGRRIASLLTGGGQEFGERSTTENVGGIAATAKSLRISLINQKSTLSHTKELRDTLLSFLERFEDVKIFSSKKGAAHILCFAMKGVRGEVMVHALEQAEIYISTTSACASKKGSFPATLDAMSIPAEWSKCAVRLSFSCGNTKAEVEIFMRVFESLHTKFQKIQ